MTPRKRPRGRPPIGIKPKSNKESSRECHQRVARNYKFVCQVCSKDYTRMATLTEHLVNFHNLSVEEAAVMKEGAKRPRNDGN